MIFEFVSEGKKGSTHKLIKFNETSLKNFYNLAFGDKNILTGDLVITDNGDSKQVLSTVVSAVYAFTE